MGALLAGFTLYLSSAGAAQAQCTTANPCASPPTDLGTLAGGNFSLANGVNADGTVVVGGSDGAGFFSSHAFRWTSATGMADLGVLAGGGFSLARGTNSDGTVVVGYSDVAGGIHAFRWTSATGMTDLGTFGGNYSFALGTNNDGSVVVGYAYLPSSAVHAFRWTSPTGMVDLGTLGGTNSFAVGTSGDGLVVVGGSEVTIGNNIQHAFRWTSAGMVDLGTLGGSGFFTTAQSTNADGSVVVGYGQVSSTFHYHAFRWTGATGLVDIGSLGGDVIQTATNSDGSVVVGTSTGVGIPYHAFRWTSATGMRDLNTLLANAGVNMTGITLSYGWAVSGNGQFIVGNGDFPGAPNHAYIVRYYDGTPAEPTAPVIAGVTNVASVQSSIDELADARLGAMAQQHGFIAPLLGRNTPMGIGNEAGVFATLGSAAGGGFARYSFGSGFSVIGGFSYATETYPDAELRSAAMGALALQYIYGGSGWWHPFAEAGGWLTPDAKLSFSRTYMNGAGTATGVGETHGDLSYYYARAGLLLAQTRSDQVALSAEYGHESMAVKAYAEELSALNPFEAHVGSGTDAVDLGKLGLAWSHRFTPALDATLWAAAVHGFNRTSELSAFVPGIGTLLPSDLGALNWAEYGVRVGYKLADSVTLDGFADGVSGGAAITTRVHVGADLRFQF
jgi:probable HAF family extracellular repeat protein